MKKIKLHTRIHKIKNKKNLKFHRRIKTIMKMLKSNKIIMKIIKNNKIPYEIYENHEKLRIP